MASNAVYWQCELKRESSTLRTRTIQAEHRLEALEQWIRDYPREFETEDWNRIEVKKQ